MPQAMKIVIAGPKGSGKSTIANYIAGSRDSLVNDRYEPTYGVRIVEAEIKNDVTRMLGTQILIEIWDSSGDTTFESSWRAIMANADGIILVYNPEAPAQDQQLTDWFEFFVRKNGLKDEQCMIFANKAANAKASNERFRPPPLFSRVTAAVLTPESGPDLKTMFENFIKDIQGLKMRENKK